MIWTRGKFIRNLKKFCRQIELPLILIGSSAFLFSCKSDKPIPQPTIQTSSIIGKLNALVINEGTFQFNNASLSFIDGANGTIQNDIGSGSGWDVAQSVTLFNGRLYVVVNNSGKVEILDPQDFHSIASVPNFTSPRYLLPIGNTKAYVTDLYADAISVLDLNSLAITKKIPCPGWTERLVYHLGKVYVCNYRKTYLYVIDPLSDTKIDSIDIGLGAHHVLVDKYDRLIVSCGGYDLKQTENQLVFINALTHQVEKKISFTQDYPSSLAINSTKDSLYYLKTHVFKISIEGDQEASTPFVSGVGKSFYGLDVDPGSNLVFITDAVDYVQRGKAYIYTASGNPVAQFSTGIVPNGFCFY